MFIAIDRIAMSAQKHNLLNPVAYFIKIIRMIVLKKSGLMNILELIMILKRQ